MTIYDKIKEYYHKFIGWFVLALILLPLLVLLNYKIFNGIVSFLEREHRREHIVEQ